MPVPSYCPLKRLIQLILNFFMSGPSSSIITLTTASAEFLRMNMSSLYILIVLYSFFNDT